MWSKIDFDAIEKTSQNILTNWLQDFLHYSKEQHYLELPLEWVILLKWNVWSKIDFDALKKLTQNILTTSLNKYKFCLALTTQVNG